MSLEWKVQETVAEIRKGELTARLRAHENDWEIEVRDRRQIGGNPLAKASGKSSSHEAAKKVAEQTVMSLLSNEEISHKSAGK